MPSRGFIFSVSNAAPDTNGFIVGLDKQAALLWIRICRAKQPNVTRGRNSWGLERIRQVFLKEKLPIIIIKCSFKALEEIAHNVASFILKLIQLNNYAEIEGRRKVQRMKLSYKPVQMHHKLIKIFCDQRPLQRSGRVAG